MRAFVSESGEFVRRFVAYARGHPEIANTYA